MFPFTVLQGFELMLIHDVYIRTTVRIYLKVYILNLAEDQYVLCLHSLDVFYILEKSGI